MTESCWGNKSRAQMTLILVLMVAVPFLLVMIALYALFGTVWSHSEKCEKLCGIMTAGAKAALIKLPWDDPNWGIPDSMGPSVIIPGYNDVLPPWQMNDSITLFNRHKRSNLENHSITIQADNSTRSRKKKFTAKYDSNKHLPFPSIAAVIENLYNDDEKEQTIMCSAAILSNNWILTTSNCVKNHMEKINYLYVRLNSKYWSKEGILTEIYKMVVFRKLAALQITDALVNFFPVIIPKDNLVKPRKGHVFLWKGKLDGPLKNRRKFSQLKAVDVRLHNSEDVGQCGSEEDCFERDSPVLDEYRHLIGFQTKVDKKKNIFSYAAVAEYHQWLNNFTIG